MEDIVLSKEDIDNFFEWLELNLQGITWEYRYQDEFDQFWQNFFVPSITIKRVQERFNYLFETVKTGPLLSWFKWLNEKLICYLFIKNEISIRELSLQFQISESDTAMILRNFFVERFILLEEELNEIFHITNVYDEKIFYTFPKIKLLLEIDEEISGTHEEDILNSLEVTLYPEWAQIIELIKKLFYNQKFNVDKIRKKATFQKQMKFIGEVSALLIIGGILILLLRVGNQAYEKYLSGKITLFEPNFLWLDKKLTYKSDNEQNLDLKLSSSELDELEKSQAQTDPFADIKEERFEVESDVSVTSIDDLPKKIEEANFEQSSYEELRKGGYRGISYGKRKAYRVMMNSSNPKGAREDLNKLLTLYEIEQVDNVKPGKIIPGGIYYNVFVPLKNLREFLAKVNVIEEVTIFESKSKGQVPRGMTKVFIWIKSI